MRLRASSCVRTPVGFVLACPGLIWASSGGLTSARLRLRLRARFGAFLESKTKIPLDLFACSTDSDSSGDRIISSQAFRAFSLITMMTTMTTPIRSMMQEPSDASSIYLIEICHRGAYSIHNRNPKQTTNRMIENKDGKNLLTIRTT